MHTRKSAYRGALVCFFVLFCKLNFSKAFSSMHIAPLQVNAVSAEIIAIFRSTCTSKTQEPKSQKVISESRNGNFESQYWVGEECSRNRGSSKWTKRFALAILYGQFLDKGCQCSLLFCLSWREYFFASSLFWVGFPWWSLWMFCWSV